MTIVNIHEAKTHFSKLLQRVMSSFHRIFSDQSHSGVVGIGLFDFGDVDGSGDAVRLQHPLGVA